MKEKNWRREGMMEFWIQSEVYRTFKSGDVGADVSGGFKGNLHEISLEKTEKF